MDFEGDEENNTSYGEYQRSIRGRATDSIYMLQRTLDSSPAISTQERHGSRRNRSPRGQASPRVRSPKGTRSPQSRSFTESQAWETSRRTEHSDYSYGAAVGRLRNMLRKHDIKSPTSPKHVQFDRPYLSPADAVSYAPGAYTPSPLAPYRGLPMSRGEIPTQEECVHSLQKQSVLIQQLEADNKFSKEELFILRQKVREVVEENKLLHDELKRSVIQEMLQEGLDVPGMSGVTGLSFTTTETSTRQMGKEDYGRWQHELEKITALHTAKASRLEAQLQHAKEEADRYEKETEELRKELRMRDSLNKADPELLGLASGLCIRCATNEAVLHPSAGMTQGYSITTITRERDELMEQLAMMKTRYEEVKYREDDMYLQIKRSIEMVEQAQLEETQLLIQRDQLKEELDSMQKRVANHAEDVMIKMAQERELVRKEFSLEMNELKAKVKELTESLVETQNSLEKTTRDKISLIAELEATKGQVDLCDIDYGKATDNMKMSMTHATLERNAAVSEMSKLKKEFDRNVKDHEQERSRIRQELYETRRRLGQAEKELVETKEECIHLTNNTQQLERETHLAKLAKESIEKNRSSDLKNISKRAEHRENELNMLIDQLEAKHTSTTSELESIVASQGGLIHKLRAECKKLANQLEDVTHKYRGDNKKLKAQNDQLRVRLDRSLNRLRDLEDQHVQHGTLQDKMRFRLRQMDEHSGKTTQQVLDLLAKESAVMRDRQLLAKEVEFLRNQMLDRNEEDMSRFYSTQKGIVDDILRDVKGQEEANLRDMIPDKDMPVLDDQLLAKDVDEFLVPEQECC